MEQLTIENTKETTNVQDMDFDPKMLIPPYYEVSPHPNQLIEILKTIQPNSDLKFIQQQLSQITLLVQQITKEIDTLFLIGQIQNNQSEEKPTKHAINKNNFLLTLAALGLTELSTSCPFTFCVCSWVST